MTEQVDDRVKALKQFAAFLNESAEEVQDSRGRVPFALIKDLLEYRIAVEQIPEGGLRWLSIHGIEDMNRRELLEVARIHVREFHEVHGKLQECKKAMQEFVDRVEKGEVRSTKTYNQFKKILGK